jgi:nucleoside-diphosphate-sugar epimerase
MHIAILGATSQIAKDLVLSFAGQSSHELVLFARRPAAVELWLESVGLPRRYPVADFDAFGVQQHIDVIINFVGVGNPAQTVAMGASIFDITLAYDELALNYVRRNPGCRYIFLSSGAAYGSSFEAPADQHTQAAVAINNVQPQDWYAVAKLHAECRHRSLSDLAIFDIRVFNYFSRTQDISARFLICDIARAISEKNVLKTSSDYIVRDFLHPSDFYRLVSALLSAPASNTAVDCYTRAPIDKGTLLTSMQQQFGLQYENMQAGANINATGAKPHYYSRNMRAADFGYLPMHTSLEGVTNEMREIFKS